MIKSGLCLALACICLVLFAMGAVWIALRLLRDNRVAVISTLPILPEQRFTVTEPGEIVVSFEVPRLSTDFREWELEVVEGKTQRVHRMRWGGPRATGTVKGFSTIKIPVGRLTLSEPDTLIFRVTGLTPQGRQAESHIVLARPHLARMALQIVGLVVCGVGMLLSLLGGLWTMGVLKSS